MDMNMGRNLVTYRRVSTNKQGESGLGLEAQDSLIRSYVEQCRGTVKQEFLEVESGKRNDRMELWKAVAYAKRHKARLVLSTLDRLGRKVALIANLMEQGIDFVCADAPHDPPMVIHIRAALAEEEGKKISERTRAALAAYKAGKRVSKRLREKYDGNVPADIVEATAGKLGASLPQCRKLTDEARAKGGATMRNQAIVAYVPLTPMMQRMRSDGLTYDAIASKLNEAGHATRSGSSWSAMQVKRVLDRVK
jgi:DNA invertase Pin-like site-specific DNA recombinase